MFKFNIKLNNEHKFRASVKDVFIFISKSTEATITKYINLNTEMKYAPRITNRLVVKTKLIVKNTTSSFADAMLRCKMKINSLSNSTSVVSGKLKSKMKFGDKCYSDVTTKITGRLISRFKNTIKNYSGDLNTLLQAKGRIEEDIIVSQNTQTHMRAKMKLNSLTDDKIKLSPYRVKAKKLDVYSDMKLNEIPYRLKNFCFYIKNDNWIDVQDSYVTWQDLERNIATWEDLIK